MKTLGKSGLFHAQKNLANIAATIVTATALATPLLQTDTPQIMKIGRNDDCPCGSGRKYKHCCLKKAAAQGVQGSATAPAAPLSATDHYIQGLAHRNLGRVDLALNSFTRALQAGGDAPAMKIDFARCAQRIQFTQAPLEFRRLVARAIAEGWIRPGDLLDSARSLILLNEAVRRSVDKAAEAWPTLLAREELFGNSSGLGTIADDPVFRAALENVPIASVEFERFLTMTRTILLDAAADIPADEPSTPYPSLDFHCSLARQCFINEYVYALTPHEDKRAGSLRDALSARLATGLPVPFSWVAAVACYFPLGSIPAARSLLQDPSAPPAIRAILKQQIEEPDQEQIFRRDMRRLSSIDDPTSLRVQKQYEENPYPRWTRTAIVTPAASLDEFMAQRFPGSAFKPLRLNAGIDILIAGCGTGQQSIETAQQYRNARVTAVDISLNSLGYAARKTRELGIGNIDYAQADLLQLDAIDQSFDLIEGLGVLHHLADPLAGWRALLAKLRPGGAMRVALYSELARASVVAGRELIARSRFTADSNGIRECRQEIMAPDKVGAFRPLLSSPDFYSMSTCRDLLFHVQEHRYTALQLKDMIDSLGLVFIGFDVDPTVLARYLERFPDDHAAVNLNNWHIFESAATDTFAGMYQFWVQKPAKQ